MADRQEGTLVIHERDLRRVKDTIDLARRNLRMSRTEFFHHDHAPLHSSIGAAEAQLDYAVVVVEAVEKHNAEEGDTDE